MSEKDRLSQFRTPDTKREKEQNGKKSSRVRCIYASAYIEANPPHTQNLTSTHSRAAVIRPRARRCGRKFLPDKSRQAQNKRVLVDDMVVIVKLANDEYLMPSI